MPLRSQISIESETTSPGKLPDPARASEVRGVRDMETTSDKLLYISEMTDQLLQLSDELNLCTLSYLLRMARLEAETAELTAQSASEAAFPPKQRSN